MMISSKTENFPTLINIFSVSENYGFVINGIKVKIRLLKIKITINLD